ncbi:hypothetical protein KIN20_018469 [Parelaphostrongylus tenuis]|uniref:Uncharacterized protein n=1 Tax=Parelaphostrongylus tenuis TaxID=148309 RepID=A0AAD5MJF3_PARTN|nr:hypothetical protein KIN20_018460 [Parelaphostrongylus tenuis]KAJ1359685.1 hypothetical protein KIN20_018469 [Parelaphostrongylus tenuis]
MFNEGPLFCSLAALSEISLLLQSSLPCRVSPKLLFKILHILVEIQIYIPPQNQVNKSFSFQYDVVEGALADPDTPRADGGHEADMNAGAQDI